MRALPRPLVAVCLVAALHAGFYIAYQRPDWNVAWTDQGGYKMLGESLATTGLFTRYPDAPRFVAETIRTPGYPLFVAAVYSVLGRSHLAIAGVQAILFVLLCLIVYAIARRTIVPAAATGAAFLTALYSPLPYFGALVMTELWTAFLLTAAMYCIVRTAQARGRGAVAAGALLGATALTRPVFVLLPFFLSGLAVAAALWSPAVRRLLTGAAVAVLAACVVLAPWFAYNWIYLGRFTISPAGGIGRGLWEGSWQGRWPGRLQASLTLTANEPISRADLDERVRALARAHGRDPAPMLEYVHQWRDIRRIWTEPVEPQERAAARVAADAEYLRVARQNIARDPAGHLRRRLGRGLFTLWAAEIPIRYTDINQVPTVVIRVIWLAQVALVALAAVGLRTIAQSRGLLEPAILAAPLVYVTLVHLPLLTEARQSLPAVPILLVLSASGAHHLWIRRRPATSPGTGDS